MPFILGTDDQGKIHFLNRDHYWVSRKDAYNFTPAKAATALTWIRQRNLYLIPSDIIVPQILEELPHES